MLLMLMTLVMLISINEWSENHFLQQLFLYSQSQTPSSLLPFPFGL